MTTFNQPRPKIIDSWPKKEEETTEIEENDRFDLEKALEKMEFEEDR
jgi:hypothetical protein